MFKLVSFTLNECDTLEEDDSHYDLLNDLIEIVGDGVIHSYYVESSTIKDKKPVFKDALKYAVYYVEKPKWGDDGRRGYPCIIEDNIVLNSIVDRVKEAKEDLGQECVFVESEALGRYYV